MYAGGEMGLDEEGRVKSGRALRKYLYSATNDPENHVNPLYCISAKTYQSLQQNGKSPLPGWHGG